MQTVASFSDLLDDPSVSRYRTKGNANHLTNGVSWEEKKKGIFV